MLCGRCPTSLKKKERDFYEICGTGRTKHSHRASLLLGAVRAQQQRHKSVKIGESACRSIALNRDGDVEDVFVTSQGCMCKGLAG